MSGPMISKNECKVLVIGSISCNTCEIINKSLRICTQKMHSNCKYYACEELCAVSHTIKNAELDPLKSICNGFYNLILVLPEFGKSAMGEIQAAKSAKIPLLFT